MCFILRVWKIKTLINTLHLFGFRDGTFQESKLIVFQCLEGFRRLNVSYFTCLEVQNVENKSHLVVFWTPRAFEYNPDPW